MNIERCLAEQLTVGARQVAATIQLLDEGATVPFIARYRKEKTGGLTDQQLWQLKEKLSYLRELEQRKQTILHSIEKQGRLTSELEAAIHATVNKTVLEDLYRPFKPKRRTKAQIAREAGLEPLALELLNHQTLNTATAAQAYLNPDHGITDPSLALEGAKQIIMEYFAEDATLMGKLRHELQAVGVLQANVMSGKEVVGKKFKDYFDYQEVLLKIPSHRALAILRGCREGILTLKIMTDPGCFERRLVDYFQLTSQWLLECANWAWQLKIFPHLELDLINELRERAETEAIQVFASNLQDLLMAAPAGMRVTLGLDPGLRTGVKLAVVDQTGKVLATDTIFPHPPHHQKEQALSRLADICKYYQVDLISIGNGTAARETDHLVAELIQRCPELQLTKVMVSEAGASVYSASEVASKEHPELDVTLRGAVSIARRLQDPLAELVKIEPKSIGVGQYQHDVNQAALSKALDQVVEACVNAVGVDVNTASVMLLKRVSGLNHAIAENIVNYRHQYGPFKMREQLHQVPRLGAKAFEQAAGFLRINGGTNPLDSSTVHPEAYAIVEAMLSQLQVNIQTIIGNKTLLKTLDPQQFVNDQFGLPTIIDIFRELEKPGHDPRPHFKNAVFQQGVNQLADLVAGMRLEGVVTNVTDFGAFVDIGVHQDGLIHISELSEQFVKDPRAVVRIGDIVNVRVLQVDLERKRINLTLKIATESKTAQKVSTLQPKKPVSKPMSGFGNMLSDALGKTKKS